MGIFHHRLILNRHWNLSGFPRVPLPFFAIYVKASQRDFFPGKLRTFTVYPDNDDSSWLETYSDAGLKAIRHSLYLLLPRKLLFWTCWEPRILSKALFAILFAFTYVIKNFFFHLCCCYSIHYSVIILCFIAIPKYSLFGRYFMHNIYSMIYFSVWGYIFNYSLVPCHCLYYI